MKIAFLTPEYPHPITGSSGGIGSSIRNLANGLIEAGVSVRVMVYGQLKDGLFHDDGIQIQTIKNIKFKGFSRFFTQNKIERIINELYQNGFVDLVEAPDWTGFTSFIKPKKCPIIIRLHGSDTYFCHIENRPVKWLNKFHERRAIKNAFAHVSVSRFTANLTNKIFSQNINYTIIPNGIDINSFKPATELVANENPIILYLGTIIRKKGVLEIPGIFNEVVKHRPSARLILIGKDSGDILTGKSSTWDLMKEKFSSAAFKNVEYRGIVPYEDVRNNLIHADVCFFPSFAEALPVSWLEAMAMEKAIVTSNIGWANEMIENGRDGYTESPSNHESFAQKVLELVNNQELRNKFGQEARKKIENEFSIEVISRRNIEFYKKICN